MKSSTKDIDTTHSNTHADADQQTSTPAYDVFHFAPLAAKSRFLDIPEEMTTADDERLLVRFVKEPSRILSIIECLSLIRAEELSGRPGNMSSYDGNINYDFRLDPTGSATFSLANSQEMREAILSGWEIRLERPS